MIVSERYSRQILFDGIGQKGQEKLLNSKVAVIGCGALGAMQLEMLARAGVKKIRAIDRDFVEFSNLHRQVMFDEKMAENQLPKAIAACERINQINSDIEVEPIVTDVNYTNIEKLIADVDLVLDGTDNFETRFLINDACIKLNKSWIYGAAVSSYGLTMVILPTKTPCLRCVFENIPPPGSAPTCDTAGVILPIIAMIASWQVVEALKILTGNLDNLHKGLIQVDLWQSTYTKVNLQGLLERSDCRACKEHKFDFLAAEKRQIMTTLCGRNSVQIVPSQSTKLNLVEMAEKLKPSAEITVNKFLLRMKIPNYEITVFSDARSIIHGTKDESLARSLYAKYIGV
ncbi:MAG: ThiF family adenylyltransferase [Acidobacteria bacterium]|nr:ThiF family adenylyltransferase [Acidobacteriota bacterium]